MEERKEDRIRRFGRGEGGWDEVVGGRGRRRGLGALGKGKEEGGWDEMVGEWEGARDEVVWGRGRRMG